MLPELMSLLPAATLVRLLEAKSFPMCATEYQHAARNIVAMCRRAHKEDLARVYWRSRPGSEVFIENEYFDRTGRLLQATDEDSAMLERVCSQLWERLRHPIARPT